MNATLSLSKPTHTLFVVTASCLFMLICDRCILPFYPVSFSLHSFGVAILSLMLSPSRILSALLMFISIKIAMGLNLFGMSGGYFLAFPIAGFAISSLQKRWPPFFALIASQVLIYLFGASWLSTYIGFKAGWIQGAFVFALSDLIKNLAALKINKYWRNS